MRSPPPGLSKRGSTWVNCNWRVQTTHVHVSSQCLAKVFFRRSISLGQPWAAFFCSFGYLLADHIVVRTYYFYHYITDTFVHRSSIVYDTKYLHTNSTTIKLDISFFENSSRNFPFVSMLEVCWPNDANKESEYTATTFSAISKVSV